MSHFKLVCLPIEYYAREFHSKALLAYQLAKSGWTVIIGQQWEIFNQLSQWLKDIQTQFSGGETEHLRSLKEIVEIISRLEYNLNHRLQLDALAVNINE